MEDVSACVSADACEDEAAVVLDPRVKVTVQL